MTFTRLTMFDKCVCRMVLPPRSRNQGSRWKKGRTGLRKSEVLRRYNFIYLCTSVSLWREKFIRQFLIIHVSVSFYLLILSPICCRQKLAMLLRVARRNKFLRIMLFWYRNHRYSRMTNQFCLPWAKFSFSIDVQVCNFVVVAMAWTRLTISLPTWSFLLFSAA